MPLPKKAFLTVLILSLSGCAPYTVEPLTTSHPAHSDAVGAARAPESQTLAYTVVDLPKRKTDGSVAAIAEPSATVPNTVAGEGKVVAVVPSSNQLVIEHGEIKGFMSAMTMGYRAEPSSLIEGFKAGDKVRFYIDVKKSSIVKIEKID